MKAVLPLALVGALAVGTAYAAGGSSSSMNTGGYQSGSQSSSASRSGQWNQGQVKQIQGKLKQQGYDVGQVDGKLGPNTQQALRQFQEDKGIQATGQPDQQTLAALNMGNQNSNQQTGQLPSGQRGGKSSSSSNMSGSSGPSGSAGSSGSNATGNSGSSGDSGMNSSGSSGTAGSSSSGSPR